MSHAADDSSQESRHPVAMAPPPLVILVVDDEAANRRLMQKALTQRGHDVLLAASGEEALEVYAAHRIDLVLMDVMMPGWDGYETTRRLRASNAHDGRWVPLIFLSALGGVPDMVRGLTAGGDDYLAKPVDLVLLDAKIAAMQRIAHLQRQLEGSLAELRTYYAESEERRQIAAGLLEQLMRHDRLPADGRFRFKVQSADGISGDLAGAACSVDGRSYLLLADAAGHGLTAAINVMPVVDCFHGLARHGYGIRHIAAAINSRLRMLPLDNFVAAVLACADPYRGQVEVLNAGMPPALLLDPKGRELGRFPSANYAFGIDEADAAGFDIAVLAARPGDQLIAYSDGLVEARDRAGNAFGEERLHELLRSCPAAARFDVTFAAVQAHEDGLTPRDDVSLAQMTFTRPEQVAPAEESDPAPGSNRLAFDFDARGLSSPDLVPHLIQLTGDLGLMPEATHQRFAMLLHEVVGRAIDHGLLGFALTAEIASEARQQRLRTFEGVLTLRLEPASVDGRRLWQLRVAVSGETATPWVSALDAGMLERHAVAVKHDGDGLGAEVCFR